MNPLVLAALASASASAAPATTATASAVAVTSPVSPSASAYAPPGSVAPPAPSAASPMAASATCQEHLGDAKERPQLTQRFPDRGLSGHAVDLEVDVLHGKGESVLPGGYKVRLGEELSVLEKAGFFLPSVDGGAGPSATTTDEGSRARTTLRIPLLLLPKKAGRQELVLPPVPIAIARASGAVVTLCTGRETVLVEDPTANDPNPTPRKNPLPKHQLEEWTAAKQVAIGAAAALVIGGVVAWLATLWMRRPKPVPPPPPPRPPWDVALEGLLDVEGSSLIAEGRLGAHIDRVSDVVREYLGRRYGFDGLESTTEEIARALSAAIPPVVVLREIRSFLDLADLVKFAKVDPAKEDCVSLLAQGREIVHRTMPAASSTAEPPAPPDPPAPSAGGEP